ncbi:MAG: potassium transporter TrkH [Desulfobacula sp.]|jgi:trk system potassium uptake protein TrkH|nr:potassium transporter TrkH [Desulfobacula sp.]
MKTASISRSSLSQVGMEGALIALSPLPFIFASIGLDSDFPPVWRIGIASLASITCLICAFTLFRRPSMGKFFGGLSSLGSFVVALPYLVSNPFAALIGTVALISAEFALLDFRVHVDHNKKNYHVNRYQQRVRWAIMMVPVVIGISMILGISDSLLSRATITVTSAMVQILFIFWSWKQRSKPLFLLPVAGFLFLILVLFSLVAGHTMTISLVISLAIFLLLPSSGPILEKREHWWEVLLNHPARILLSTFFALSVLGTLILIIPASTTGGGIGLVDAAFTSMSAVCVTGLIVLDTPADFSMLGQFFIIVLIQLGGLGIMSIATVALHAMGRRLSLRQERLLTSMTDTGHKDLVSSLIVILKFTFIAEAAGAFILTGLFYSAGDTLGQASWRGLFTAISAFCNAGFALQSDSLISYQNNPLILHVVAVLIVFGGLAPATSLILPNWMRRQQIPVTARISLITTTVLLISGTFFMLAFEWNGILSDLSFLDKIHNAWFQSVTIRTAGFNSVDITGMISPTFLVMLCLMFIGGSPGSTAGGVKTTTIGILAMTFLASITNRNVVIVQNRRVLSGTIYRAITIVASGAIIWFIMVLMLEITQQISVRDIIFEVTSAIGTVGLSTGATAYLDEIGKIIVMTAMFTGRIGSMTLFMLIGQDQSTPASRCPDARITLT